MPLIFNYSKGKVGSVLFCEPGGEGDKILSLCMFCKFQGFLQSRDCHLNAVDLVDRG